MQQREFDILLDRAPGQQRKILEHEGQRIEAAGGGAPRNSAPPALGCSNPPRIDNSVLLPQPDGPTIATTSPDPDRERHVVEHLERAEAVTDMVGDQIHRVSCFRMQPEN